MLKLPHLPDGFTPSFMTEVLRHAGVLAQDQAVVAVSPSQVGEGTGMMSEVAGLSVTYAQQNLVAPQNFIAKFASQIETNRQIALSYRLYERETRFFNELDPLTSARTPHIYFSGCDGERMLILMEDMRDYDVGSQVAGATLRQSELAIDELAKLHGAFCNDVDTLDWIPLIADSYHADNMVELTRAGFEPMFEKFEGALTHDLWARRERFLGSIRDLQAYMASGPLTLCHGDYRMENLLYGNRSTHHPVVVLDWQGPLRARGINDVALFLTQSTRTDVRREHEKTLLDRYARGLQTNGAARPSAEEIWSQYRMATLYNWIYITVVAGTLDVSNATAHAWIYQSLLRHSAASLDLGVFDLLPAS